MITHVCRRPATIGDVIIIDDIIIDEEMQKHNLPEKRGSSEQQGKHVDLLASAVG
jgi:hypothetical protein